MKLNLFTVFLIALSLDAEAFSPSRTHDASSTTSLKMGFFDDIFNLNSPSTTAVKSPAPKVQVPDDFVIPEPKPLTLTRPSDIGSTLKSSAALAVRLATSCFVLG